MLAKSCIKCGKVGKAICDPCKQGVRARSPKRSRQARGYGRDYDLAREALERDICDIPDEPGQNAQTGADQGKSGHPGQDGVNRGRSPKPLKPDILCVVCGLPFLAGESWTAEHIKPLRDGGTSDRANLGPAHARCNFGWRGHVAP